MNSPLQAPRMRAAVRRVKAGGERFLGGVLPGATARRLQTAAFADEWAAANLDARQATGPLWVVLGDSASQGVGATRRESGYVGVMHELLRRRDAWRVINLSKSGAGVLDVLARQLPELAALANVDEPALITCLIGTEDVARRTPGLDTALRQVISQLPTGTVVGLLPHGPRTAGALNSVIREEAERHAMRIAVLPPRLPGMLRGRDGRFLDDVGHAAWARAVLAAADGPVAVAAPATDPRLPVVPPLDTSPPTDPRLPVVPALDTALRTDPALPAVPAGGAGDAVDDATVTDRLSGSDAMVTDRLSAADLATARAAATGDEIGEPTAERDEPAAESSDAAVDAAPETDVEPVAESEPEPEPVADADQAPAEPTVPPTAEDTTTEDVTADNAADATADATAEDVAEARSADVRSDRDVPVVDVPAADTTTVDSPAVDTAAVDTAAVDTAATDTPAPTATPVPTATTAVEQVGEPERAAVEEPAAEPERAATAEPVTASAPDPVDAARDEHPSTGPASLSDPDAGSAAPERPAAEPVAPPSWYPADRSASPVSSIAPSPFPRPFPETPDEYTRPVRDDSADDGPDEVVEIEIEVEGPAPLVVEVERIETDTPDVPGAAPQVEVDLFAPAPPRTAPTGEQTAADGNGHNGSGNGNGNGHSAEQPADGHLNGLAGRADR